MTNYRKLRAGSIPLTPPEGDAVNHPNHYTQGIEVYQFIESWEMSFAEGNVIKYVTRAPYKNRKLQDLEKARWYLDRLIEAAQKERA